MLISINFNLAHFRIFLGWGPTSSGGSVSNLLRNVKLNIYNPTLCSGYGSTNWNTQVCSGDTGKDTCQGKFFKFIDDE